jgi:hypothetical protein
MKSNKTYTMHPLGMDIHTVEELAVRFVCPLTEEYERVLEDLIQNKTPFSIWPIKGVGVVEAKVTKEMSGMLISNDEKVAYVYSSEPDGYLESEEYKNLFEKRDSKSCYIPFSERVDF